MANEYTSQSKVESHLGLASNKLDGTLISTLVKMATRYIEEEAGTDRWGNRYFNSSRGDTGKTKKFDGSGQEHLRIPDLYNLSKVVIDGTEVDSSNILQYPANQKPKIKLEIFQEKIGNQNSRLINTSNYAVFDKGQQNIEITGDWYYSSSTPDEIEGIATLIAAAYIKDSFDEELNKPTEEKFDDYSVSYEKVKDNADRIGAKDLLEQFSRDDVINHGVKKLRNDVHRTPEYKNRNRNSKL